MEYEYYLKGAYVFRQGEIGSKFYIILDGEVGVWVTRENSETGKTEEFEAIRLYQGESFGERAII